LAKINSEAYLRARLADCELTQQIITLVDDCLKEKHQSSRCSDSDSLKLELKDKYLIEVEFSSGANRGSGQQRLWKNGATKRYTNTIVAFRENVIDKIFTHAEIYSPFTKKQPVRRNVHNLAELANLINNIINHILSLPK